MNPFTLSSMAVAAIVAVTALGGCAHRSGDHAEQGPMMGSGTGAKHGMGTMPMHDGCPAGMQEKHQRMDEQHARNRDLPESDVRPRADCPMKTP